MTRILLAILFAFTLGCERTSHVETFEGRIEAKKHIPARTETEVVPVVGIDSDGNATLSFESRSVFYPETWTISVMEHDSDGFPQKLMTIHVTEEVFGMAEEKSWYRRENRVFGEAPPVRNTKALEATQ